MQTQVLRGQVRASPDATWCSVHRGAGGGREIWRASLLSFQGAGCGGRVSVARCTAGAGRQSPGVQTNLPGDPALPPHTPIRPSPPAPAEQLRSGRFSSGEPLPHFQMLLSLSCHSDPSVLSLPTHGPWLSAFHLLERSRPVLEGRPSGFSTAKSTLGCRSFSLPWNSVYTHWLHREHWLVSGMIHHPSGHHQGAWLCRFRTLYVAGAWQVAIEK